MNNGKVGVSAASGARILAALAVAGLLIGTVQATDAGAATTARAGATVPAAVNAQVVEVGDPSLADRPQLAVVGTVIVAAVDRRDDAGTQYSVTTEAGTIRIAGDLGELTTGSTFTGTVALPESLTDRLNSRYSARVERSASDPIGSATAEGVTLLQLAQTAQEALPVVTASVELAEATFGTAAHTVDVAVINGASFSDTDVNTNVAALGQFWVGQSEGAITGVTRPNAVQRYTSPYLASCNFNAMWDEAARRFLGSSAGAEDYLSLSGRHLVVIADQDYDSANCGTGIGSVGSGANGSGVIWANVTGETDLHTLAHEFGHNLGLGHANVHECDSSSRVEGTTAQGCRDYEYEDLYDVMSLAFEYTGIATTNQLAALNVTDRVRLGLLPPSDLSVVTAKEQNLSLAPASATTGIRGISVSDAITGDTYYVEYRSGTGMDAGAFYTKNFPAGSPAILADLRPGVRILKLRPVVNGAAASVALALLRQPGDPVKMLAMKVGDTFSTASGGLQVSFTGTAGGNAQVTVKRHSLPSTVDRISGGNRYETAVAISQNAFPSGAPVVYVALGLNYPDALSAAPAAVKEGGPLLLTEGNRLTPVVKAEIQRLDPEKIVVVGGSGVVGPAVFSALKAMQSNTIRLGGANRYETSRLVVEQAFDSTAVAYVATGRGFPDALSASAAAGATGSPVILIDGALGSVDAATRNLLQALGVTQTRIAGGTGVVSTGAASSLATVSTVTRSAGTNRFDTSHLVNSAIFTSAEQTYLATGYQFPDALAGAALAGAKSAPLYLVQTACVPADIRMDLILGGAENVTLLGGTGVLTARVAQLKSC